MATCLGVQLVDTVRPPVTDPTFGINVQTNRRRDDWAHRLVTIGDSLTHGFQHLAIFNTANSWPALIARQLGIDFAFPTYPGPGGYPVNLEYIARKLNSNIIDEIIGVGEYLETVKKAYAGTASRGGTPNENLAILGWDLRDTLVRTADTERAQIGRPSLIKPLVNAARAR